MTYHWPTADAWLMMGIWVTCATVLGGWPGCLIMLGYCVFVSVLGNLLWP
jgi:hypothetical protein